MSGDSPSILDRAAACGTKKRSRSCAHSGGYAPQAAPVAPRRRTGAFQRSSVPSFQRGVPPPHARPSQPVLMLAKRLSTVGTFANYGTTVTRVEIRERVLRALQRSRVLTPTNSELIGYFERVVEQIASPFAGSGEDDAVSSSSDDELAQTAILFMHYDADGDGLLSHAEFTALIQGTGAVQFHQPGHPVARLRLDFDLLPEWRMSFNLNHLWFDTTEVLEVSRNWKRQR